MCRMQGTNAQPCQTAMRSCILHVVHQKPPAAGRSGMPTMQGEVPRGPHTNNTAE